MPFCVNQWNIIVKFYQFNLDKLDNYLLNQWTFLNRNVPTSIFYIKLNSTKTLQHKRGFYLYKLNN